MRKYRVGCQACHGLGYIGVYRREESRKDGLATEGRLVALKEHRVPFGARILMTEDGSGTERRDRCWEREPQTYPPGHPPPDKSHQPRFAERTLRGFDAHSRGRFCFSSANPEHRYRSMTPHFSAPRTPRHVFPGDAAELAERSLRHLRRGIQKARPQRSPFF